MNDFYKEIIAIDLSASRDKSDVINELAGKSTNYGYVVDDVDTNKPWGGFVRFNTKDADHFIANFFTGIDAKEARLGNVDMELSPKFLLVAPGARLSWQRHARRAERWSYITAGAYHKSKDPDNQGEQTAAQPGEIVQFERGECHRLVGLPGSTYTLVAEIWQHTNPQDPSEESDIERLADDYKR